MVLSDSFEFSRKLFKWFSDFFVSFNCDRNVILNFNNAAAKSLQSCQTLCDPIDGSLPGSSIHGIFQARVLEWRYIHIFFATNRDRLFHLAVLKLYLVNTNFPSLLP